MTVSLAVILLETTGNYQLGLPLMVALVTARFVGNLFGEGIYDLHVSVRWKRVENHFMLAAWCARSAFVAGHSSPSIYPSYWLHGCESAM